MDDNEIFADLIGRLRAGDPRAAEELVRQCEPEIRREVRVWMRLRDPRLRRVFDSMDICQSVLASFFVRAAAGQYDLERPEQLLHLLAGMARNKLAEQVQYQQRQRRDVRRAQSLGPEAMDLAGGSESPSTQVAGEELLRKLRGRLSDEERRLAEHRAQGHSWADIAAELGGTAEAHRKQLARALDRVVKEMGLEGVRP
jgi:RNA polymerase sigma-70 factor (ECF subfamily)